MAFFLWKVGPLGFWVLPWPVQDKKCGETPPGRKSRPRMKGGFRVRLAGPAVPSQAPCSLLPSWPAPTRYLGLCEAYVSQLPVWVAQPLGRPGSASRSFPELAGGSSGGGSLSWISAPHFLAFSLWTVTSSILNTRTRPPGGHFLTMGAWDFLLIPDNRPLEKEDSGGGEKCTLFFCFFSFQASSSLIFDDFFQPLCNIDCLS